MITELLCGCRINGPEGVMKRCTEARGLLRATRGHDPLDPDDSEWNAYSAHYTDPENIPVRNLVNGKWVNIE